MGLRCLSCTTQTCWTTTLMKSRLRRGNVSSRKNRWTPRITQTWRRSGGSFLCSGFEARKSIGEDRLLGQEGVESAEELQQRVRTAKEQLASTSAILKAIRLRLRRRRQSFYEEELRLAWKRRDLAATFRWSRLLGGRRWGAKKRDYRAMSAALPLKKAWKDEWSKPGAEGGMGAVELESWSEWRIQSRDLVRRSELNARVSEDARRDLEELKSSYRTVKMHAKHALPWILGRAQTSETRKGKKTRSHPLRVSRLETESCGRVQRLLTKFSQSQKNIEERRNCVFDAQFL